MRIEATCWLVKEQQERRLRGEFHADRQSLLRLDAQRANNGVGDVSKLQEVDDLVDVLQLLFAGHFSPLPEERRELESLSHRRTALVQIHLLDKASSALEIWLESFAVDQHLAFHNTH